MASNGFNDRSNGQNGRMPRYEQMCSQATRTIQTIDHDKYESLFGTMQQSVPPSEPKMITLNAKIVDRFFNDGGDTKYAWYLVKADLNGVPSMILTSVGFDRQDSRECHNAKVSAFDSYMTVGSTVGVVGELVGGVITRLPNGKTSGFYDLLHVTAVAKEILSFENFDASNLPSKTRRTAPAQRENRPTREARPTPTTAESAK